MKIPTTGILLMIFMGGARAQQSEQPSGRAWKTAKVLDATAAKNYVEAQDRTGATTTLTVRDTQLLLVSDEFAYVVNDTRTSNRIPLHQGVTGDSSAIVHAVPDAITDAASSWATM